MAGWFELHKSDNGEFRFVLKAGNAETILTSEQYKSKDAAKNGIASVQKNCNDENCFEAKEAKNGKLYFVLKSTNHQVIGNSQMYADAGGRKNGMESVANNGSSDTVKDMTAG